VVIEELPIGAIVIFLDREYYLTVMTFSLLKKKGQYFKKHAWVDGLANIFYIKLVEELPSISIRIVPN